MKTVAGGDDFLVRLKSDTRAEHSAVETALDLMGDGLTPEQYRRTLEGFYGFYLPVENRLREIGGWSAWGIDLDERRKAPLLERDLAAFGVGAGTLPVCHEFPPLEGHAAGFGCLYVLEGATLGGRFISRHARTKLGITPETGGSFFAGYGERTGEMWAAFRTSLVAFAAPIRTQDEIISAAIHSFQALRHWCRGAPAP